MRSWVSLCAIGLACCGRGETVKQTPTVDSTTTSAKGQGVLSASTGYPSTRVREILEAELSRRIDGLRPEDQKSRSVVVRRAAARAFARIRGPKARAGLLHALADEDEMVVAWGAYGIGDQCAGYRDAAVRALLAALAVWPAKQGEPRKESDLNANRAIVRAIGRCASNFSEPALVRLLRGKVGPRHAAIAALGDVASQRHKLREETFVALLKIAAGDASSAADAYAFYPYGRVAHLPPSVVEKTREVAAAALAKRGIGRVFAIVALGRTEPLAVKSLRSVIGDAKSFDATERAEAIRAVVRFGQVGQRALHKLLPKLIPAEDAVSLSTMVSADFGVLLTLLTSLREVRSVRGQLRRLTARTAPAGAPASILRRLSWMRCSAARLVAERDYDAKLLRDCDLTRSGSIGARAMVAALGIDGTKLRGRRLARWREYATGDKIRARQDAIAQIAAHPEIRGVGAVLASALSSKYPGVVAAAAEVVNKHPQRGRRPGRAGRQRGTQAVDAGVRKALLAQLREQGPERDIEALSAVAQAVSALGLDEAKPALKRMCQSPYETLRQHARQALVALGGGRGKISCPAPKAGLPPAAELDHLLTQPVTVQLQTDAGALTLTLEPSLTPLAVTRVIDLVKRGYYDGMVVHRVVPGFVSQFGSPTADGYGGAPKAPAMPCETSPLHYGRWRVGVALAGRDTGSSQLFVTHASFPRLDGRYAQVGTATGPWDALVEGDRITRATAKE